MQLEFHSTQPPPPCRLWPRVRHHRRVLWMPGLIIPGRQVGRACGRHRGFHLRHCGPSRWCFARVKFSCGVCVVRGATSSDSLFLSSSVLSLSVRNQDLVAPGVNGNHHTTRNSDRQNTNKIKELQFFSYNLIAPSTVSKTPQPQKVRPVLF